VIAPHARTTTCLAVVWGKKGKGYRVRVRVRERERERDTHTHTHTTRHMRNKKRTGPDERHI
jgi:hypothetical protein